MKSDEASGLGPPEEEINERVGSRDVQKDEPQRDGRGTRRALARANIRYHSSSVERGWATRQSFNCFLPSCTTLPS